MASESVAPQRPGKAEGPTVDQTKSRDPLAIATIAKRKASSITATTNSPPETQKPFEQADQEVWWNLPVTGVPRRTASIPSCSGPPPDPAVQSENLTGDVL